MVRNTLVAALWRIFPSNKSVPANRKKGFYTSHLPKNEEIGGNFVFLPEPVAEFIDPNSYFNLTPYRSYEFGYW
jgi:hypothetical protein